MIVTADSDLGMITETVEAFPAFERKSPLPTYISKKWKDSLNQAGYEAFYPLASHSALDEQFPVRYR